jgi:hypothetical protein
MKHYIITRFNIGSPVENELNWLKYRLYLIKNVTYNSILNQSCKNFEWIILVNNNRTSEELNVELNKCGKVLDINNYIEYIQQINHGDIILSTRLDSDDLIHKDFVKIVQDNFYKLQNDNSVHIPYIIDFSCGAVYNCKSSSKLFLRYPTPFLTKVEYGENSELCYSDKHSRMATRYQTIKIELNFPIWMQLIHNGNSSNRFNSKRISIDITEYGISTRFIIDNTIIVKSPFKTDLELLN